MSDLKIVVRVPVPASDQRKWYLGPVQFADLAHIQITPQYRGRRHVTYRKSCPAFPRWVRIGTMQKMHIVQ
jgi:hypothetical protein